MLAYSRRSGERVVRCDRQCITLRSVFVVIRLRLARASLRSAQFFRGWFIVLTTSSDAMCFHATCMQTRWIDQCVTDRIRPALASLLRQLVRAKS